MGIKVGISDVRDHKYNSTVNFYLVFWGDGGPEVVNMVLRKRLTRNFATKIYIKLQKKYAFCKEYSGWREYLKKTTIKEYEPV